LKTLIIGCGSIGLRHLRNLRAIGVDDLAAMDDDPARLQTANDESGAEGFTSLDEALARQPDAVVVATPSNTHLSIARKVVEAGCNVMVEKPLSAEAAGMDDLVSLSEDKGLTTMVACNMRFHHGPRTIKKLLEDGAVGNFITAILDAGQYMPDWQPGRDYRDRYSAHRSAGGGVLLDGIHEVDYARWLFGDVDSVFCHGGQMSTLDIDVEDTANITLSFSSGRSAMVHIDYIQRAYARSCKVIGEDGTITWDINDGTVRWYSAASGTWTNYPPPDDYSINDMYVDEMQHFIDAARSGTPTMHDFRDAATVTRIAFAARDSMESGQSVSL
jgi:predicted dehydrogenase